MIGFLSACAIGFACSAAAVHAPNAETRFARFFQNVARQPLEALGAPLRKKIGAFDVGGKFGSSDNVLTGDLPSLLKNGVEVVRATSLPNTIMGVNGIGFDCSSPLTLGRSGIQESSQASTFLLQWLLLGVDGVANTAAATAPSQFKAEITKLRNVTVNVADLIRWNADTTVVRLGLGSADNSRS